MSTTFSINDIRAMTTAIKLAAKGRYGVAPNPMVGCVIVKDGKVIAQGYHQVFGQNHAEINALEEINYQAQETTFYITLEPCSYHGKTPPCAQAIIDSGAKKVVISMLDPNPLVSGKGVSMLKAAGIKVDTNLLADESATLNLSFIKRIQTGQPFVTCKIAMSIDGKTSLASGDSKWISSVAARLQVQQLRADNQAIMTGSGTIIADNPLMTVRLDSVNVKPLRVVIDGQNQIQGNEFNIFNKDAPSLVLNASNTKVSASGKLDLKDALKQLGDKKINNVLLEAGPGLTGAMIKQKLVDELIIYTAPAIMGSNANSMVDISIENMSDKIKLKIDNISMVGDDIKIVAKLK